VQPPWLHSIGVPQDSLGLEVEHAKAFNFVPHVAGWPQTAGAEKGREKGKGKLKAKEAAEKSQVAQSKRCAAPYFAHKLYASSSGSPGPAKRTKNQGRRTKDEAARDGVACMDAYAKHLRQRLDSHGPEKRSRELGKAAGAGLPKAPPTQPHMWAGDPQDLASLRATA